MSEVPFRACPSSSMTIEEIEIPDCKGSSSGVDLREPRDWTRDVWAIGFVLSLIVSFKTKTNTTTIRVYTRETVWRNGKSSMEQLLLSFAVCSIYPQGTPHNYNANPQLLLILANRNVNNKPIGQIQTSKGLSCMETNHFFFDELLPLFPSRIRPDRKPERRRFLLGSFSAVLFRPTCASRVSDALFGPRAGV